MAKEQACETVDGCNRPATWHITGLGPGCSDSACCGWEEYACDDHKEEALSAMGQRWALTAERLAVKA